MKRIETIMICAGLLPATSALSQTQAKDSTLNRTVVVENEYNPEVMDAFKVNVLPEVEEPTVAKRNIEYATGLHPLTRWNAVPMDPIERELLQHSYGRGYARAAYGNRNNADFKFSYLWDITPKDHLGVMSSVHGLSGSMPYWEKGSWNARFFRTDVALDYRHEFRHVALKTGGLYASQVFNYMPATPDTQPSRTDKQHYTDAEGYIGVESCQKSDLPVEFSFRTGLRSFQRKYGYPYLRLGNIDGEQIGSESAFHTKGYLAASLEEGQKVGVALAMDNMLGADMDLQDYTLVQGNPYYEFQNDIIRLHAGAHVDWQFGYGKGIRVAPDVTLSCAFAVSYVFFAQAVGGSVLNDSRRLNEISPYQMQLQQLSTSHTRIDASLGFKGAPVDGLGFKAYLGYRVTGDEVFVYPGYLAQISQEGVVVNATDYIYSFLLQDKARVGYGGVDVSYAYKDWFDLGIRTLFQDWKVSEGQKALLVLKPKFTLDLSARVKVFKGLHAGAGYRYAKRHSVEGVDASFVSNLSVSGEYELLDRINVFVSFDNLLNKKYVDDAGYPAQRFHAMGGISCTF